MINKKTNADIAFNEERWKNRKVGEPRYRDLDEINRNQKKILRRKRIRLVVVLLLFIIIAVLFSLQKGEIKREDGVLVPSEPIRESLDPPVTFILEEAIITKYAKMSFDARVLSKRKMNFLDLDIMRDLSSYDLFLSWGAMSDSKIIDKMTFSQKNRFVLPLPKGYVSTRFPPPLDSFRINPFEKGELPTEWNVLETTHAHVINLDKDIDRTLSKIRKGHIVRVEGYLSAVRLRDSERALEPGLQSSYDWFGALEEGEVYRRPLTGRAWADKCITIWVESIEILD